MDDGQRFREVFNRVEAHIERRYGLPVVLTDVPDPFTGDLDGATVMVDWDIAPEEALFVLVHLFGHTVQWNVSARERELGLLEVKAGTDVPEALLAELAAYEVTAARYSMQLFHEAGVDDLDQWLSDFATCDVAYLLAYYRSGEKNAFRSFWRDGTPLIQPLEIPPFRPAKWTTRFGTVV
jgi:hypothetical protein